MWCHGEEGWQEKYQIARPAENAFGYSAVGVPVAEMAGGVAAAETTRPART
jgi:hypothetical protein